MPSNTVLSGAAPIELWRHANPEGTQMFKFLQHVNSKYGLTLSDYPALYKWSIDNVAAFWEETWHFVRIVASKSYKQVCASLTPSSTQGCIPRDKSNSQVEIPCHVYTESAFI